MSSPELPGRSGVRPTLPGALSEADNAALGAAKQTLRRAVRTRRAARNTAAREAADHARAERVREFLGAPRPGTIVAAYLSVGDEPGTLELISWLYAAGARVLLPVLSKRPDGSPRRQADWAAYAGAEDLRAGLWGIPEPSTDPLGPEGLAEAGVIIAPGLAGTARGDRLGMGGGWYDRARAYAAGDAVTVLLLNDDEVLPTLPVQDWDLPVDVIATEQRLLNCLER